MANSACWFTNYKPQLDLLTDAEFEYVQRVTGGREENIVPLLAWLDKKKSSLSEIDYHRYVQEESPLNDSQMRAIRNVYFTSVPEGSTYLGTLLTHNHLEPRQQINLDAAKRACKKNSSDVDEETRDTMAPPTFTQKIQQFRSRSYYRQPNGRKLCEDSMRQLKNDCMLGISTSATTIKFTSLILSVVPRPEFWPSDTVLSDAALYAQAVHLFDKIYAQHLTTDSFGVELKEVLIERNANQQPCQIKFYFLLYSPDKSALLNIVGQLSGMLKIDNGSTVVGQSTVYIIFSSLENIFGKHEPQMAATFLEGMTETINTTTFLYCCLTGRYKPVIETQNDSITVIMTQILSLMRCVVGGRTLKRTGLAKTDVGPLTFIAGESGRYEVSKYLETLNKRRRLEPNSENHAPQYPIEAPNQMFILNLPTDNNVLAKDVMLDDAMYF